MIIIMIIMIIIIIIIIILCSKWISRKCNYKFIRHAGVNNSINIKNKLICYTDHFAMEL